MSRASSVFGSNSHSALQDQITEDQRRKLDAQFDQADTNGDGVIDAKEALTFFSKSGLPKDTLAQIWEMSDSKKTGSLGRPEFYTAMQLVMEAKKGVPPSRPADKKAFEAASITPEQLRQYGHWFTQSDKENRGYLTAQETWNFLQKSKLNKPVLKAICVLAVTNPDDGIRKQEFSVAVHLTQSAVRSMPIPEKLPPQLQSMIDQTTASRRLSAASSASVSTDTSAFADAMQTATSNDDLRKEQRQAEHMSSTQAMLSTGVQRRTATLLRPPPVTEDSLESVPKFVSHDVGHRT